MNGREASLLTEGSPVAVGNQDILERWESVSR